MAIEIVRVSPFRMMMFHSYVAVYLGVHIFLGTEKKGGVFGGDGIAEPLGIAIAIGVNWPKIVVVFPWFFLVPNRDFLKADHKNQGLGLSQYCWTMLDTLNYWDFPCTNNLGLTKCVQPKIGTFTVKIR